jgi:hypothetical protein
VAQWMRPGWPSGLDSVGSVAIVHWSTLDLIQNSLRPAGLLTDLHGPVRPNTAHLHVGSRLTPTRHRPPPSQARSTFSLRCGALVATAPAAVWLTRWGALAWTSLRTRVPVYPVGHGSKAGSRRRRCGEQRISAHKRGVATTKRATPRF